MVQLIIKRKVCFFCLTLFLFFSISLTAQQNRRLENQFERALAYFNSNDYEAATNLVLNIIVKDSSYQDAYLLLSDVYHEIDSVELEIECLSKALRIEQTPAILYRLAEASYSIGIYENAMKNYELWINAESNSEYLIPDVQHKMENCRFAIEAQKNPVRFTPEPLNDNVNSTSDEYWPSISIDEQELIFTRLITSDGRLPQEDFYSSVFEGNEWELAQPVTEINTSRNEGAQVLSPDGRWLFFTACNREDGLGSCDIYYSRLVDGKWSSPKNAGEPVSTYYWDAQPGISSDNRFLYFSSNRAGGKGGKDIWRAEILGTNVYGNIVWSEPENLGGSINTKGEEISPFLHPNNKDLYFVSDFLTGMGGFDLFVSEIKSDGSPGTAKNMGFPINTYKDEQGLTITADGRKAYFASQRDKNYGLDIYWFDMPEEIRPDPVTYVKAKVIDGKTKEPVQVRVDLADLTTDSSVFRSEFTDQSGEVLFCLPLGANYAFNIAPEGYLFYSQSFELSNIKTVSEPYIFTIEIQPLAVGAEMDLYNIYFETDSFRILPESEVELQKLISFLNGNSGLKVEIQGHTDSTGSVEYNQDLSELRARSVVDYLIQRGIEPNRLTYKGYGQNRPVAGNDTESGRRVNRRTTVKIVEI